MTSGIPALVHVVRIIIAYRTGLLTYFDHKITSGPVEDVFVVENYTYIAASGGGLLVIDISDPENPCLVGHLDTNGSASGVYIFDRYAYLADRYAGQKIIDINNPKNPQIVGYLDTNGRVSIRQHGSGRGQGYVALGTAMER